MPSLPIVPTKVALRGNVGSLISEFAGVYLSKRTSKFRNSCDALFCNQMALSKEPWASDYKDARDNNDTITYQSQGKTDKNLTQWADWAYHWLPLFLADFLRPFTTLSVQYPAP